MRNRLVVALAAALLLAACGPQGSDDPVDSDDTPPVSTPSGGSPVLVVAQGGGDGRGITVAEALGHRATDDLVTVTGALFVDADGTIRLCDAIAESFPPQCAGERIEVEGLDLATVADLQEGGEIRWAEGVTLFGSVE